MKIFVGGAALVALAILAGCTTQQLQVACLVDGALQPVAASVLAQAGATGAEVASVRPLTRISRFVLPGTASTSV